MIRTDYPTRRLGHFGLRISRWCEASSLVARFSGALSVALLFSFASTTHAVNDTATVTSRVLSGRGTVEPPGPITVDIGTPVPTQYTVNVNVGPFGNVSPPFPQTVLPGARLVYTVTPNADYRAAVSGTCSGSLVGNTYTTEPIADNCTVNVLFWPMHPAKVNDLNGDGKSDLILWDPNGRNNALLMNGASVATRAPLSFLGDSAFVVASGDFDGDGKADVITYDRSDSTYRVVLMNGVTPISSAVLPLSANNGWSIVGVADFNGDGKSDFVLQGNVGIQPFGTYLVTMNGTQAVRTWASGVPNTHFAEKVADLNGDGTPDLIFRHYITNEVSVGIVRDGVVEALVPINIGGRDWFVTHVGDLDGDGKADLIAQNQVDGRVTLYLMNGATVKASSTIIAANSGWRVTRVGDFDGDGKSDLLLKHAQGRTYMMLMDGLRTASAGLISPSGSGWSVTYLSDFNGDGKMDLVFQNTNGAIDVWLMNGTTLLRKANIEPPGTTWIPTPPQ
jgi:FG-GAP-like repeat